MKITKRHFWTAFFLIAVLTLAAGGLSARAQQTPPPALPSSLYGTVRLPRSGAQSIPAGVTVSAYAGNRLLAQTVTQTYNGETVYSLDLPMDGVAPNQPITFTIGNLRVFHTYPAQSGTSVQRNLEAGYGVFLPIIR